MTKHKIKPLKWKKEKLEDNSGVFYIAEPIKDILTIEIDTEYSNPSRFEIIVHWGRIGSESSLFVVKPKRAKSIGEAEAEANKLWETKIAPKLLKNILI